jgi:spermidine synthase
MPVVITDSRRDLSGALFLVGFLSLSSQVLVLRELAVAFFGVELVYLVALGLWLAISGAGALALRQRAPGRASRLAWLFFGLALLLPLEMAALRVARAVLQAAPGAYLPLGRGASLMLMAVAPIALWSGLMFERLMRHTLARGGTFASAYAIECAGALSGGLAQGLALAAGGSSWQMTIVLAALACVAPWSLMAEWRRGRALAILLGSLLATAGWVTASRVEQRLDARAHPQLVISRDSPYGRLTMTRRLDQTVVYINDALAYESEGVDDEAFFHTAALLHPAPRRIAILGGALADWPRLALAHHPDQVTLIEIDERLFSAGRMWLSAEARVALADVRVRLLFNDPRAALAREKDFDLIVVAAGEPDSGQGNRLFTREFFALCRARLAPAGVLALRLRASENYTSPALAARTASVYRALQAVFGDVIVIPSAALTLAAADRPLPRDPEMLSARLRERRIQASLVSPAYLRYVLTNDRVRAMEARLGETRVPINSDDRPICYLYTMMIALAKYIPALLRFDLFGALEGDRAAFWLGALWPLALAPGLLMLRRRPRARRVTLAFLAGFAGMAAEGVWLLGYQARHGILFAWLGVLLATFMAGLATGSFYIGRRHSVAVDRGRQFGRRLLIGFALAVGSMALRLIASDMRIPSQIDQALFFMAMALLGGFVGAVLAWLGAQTASAAQAATLYAADLWGGCAGALLGAVVLAPLAGLAGTMMGLAVALLAAVFLIE